MVREHIAGGGRAVLPEKDGGKEVIVLYERHERYVVGAVKDIPATYSGHARFNVANVLAAVGVTYCMGASLEVIRGGLQSFEMSYAAAPGRMNVFDEYPFTVIVDYAHNAAAMEAMREYVQTVKVKGRRIGMLSAPGDRRDEDMRELSRIAAQAFDHLIFRDDRDRRGRAEGEMPKIMQDSAIASGKTLETAEIVLQWDAAVRRALDIAQAGDLVVLFAENIAGTWELVTRYGESDAYKSRFESGQSDPHRKRVQGKAEKANS
jgi:cyanophycin synthetase